MFLLNTPTQAPLGPPTTTDSRHPTPEGSVPLGSLRSPSLHLPIRGWVAAARKQFTERFLHRPQGWASPISGMLRWLRRSLRDKLTELVIARPLGHRSGNGILFGCAAGSGRCARRSSCIHWCSFRRCSFRRLTNQTAVPANASDCSNQVSARSTAWRCWDAIDSARLWACAKSR